MESIKTKITREVKIPKNYYNKQDLYVPKNIKVSITENLLYCPKQTKTKETLGNTEIHNRVNHMLKMS